MNKMKKRILILLAIGLLACCAVAHGETALPPYVSQKSDPILAAVENYTATLGNDYSQPEGCVCIPAAVILKTVREDETHARVYGNFWQFNYVLEDTTLLMVSGGEAPGYMDLEKQGEGWAVVNFYEVPGGEDFDRDIECLCDGDQELLDGFGWANDTKEALRGVYISEYAQANGLNITAYQDPFWDPIPLETPRE